MPNNPQPTWVFNRFIEVFDIWTARENPDEDLSLRVLAWVMNRHGDPRAAAHRVEGFENLWFAVIPRTARNGKYVTCSYFIKERERLVIADIIISLRPPFM